MESNLVILTNKVRFQRFCKIYWRTLVIIATPFILLPFAFIGNNNAYTCFYIFLLSIVYWVADVMHPCVVSIILVALSTLAGAFNKDFVIQFVARGCLLNALGMMMIIVAIEKSMLHRRVAIKLLMIFGCSHYRLSFLLFFSTAFLSMWVSDAVACGLMMPLVRAILTELERMGILEVFQIVGKERQRSNRHETNTPRPTDFTVFYFLGIAYSSSIGSMGTMIGSETNNIFRVYCEVLSPNRPKIEFPHFMLLNLPGVIVMELLVYVWMNSYFLGMFRGQSEIALEIGMSEEEAAYIKMLLTNQYSNLRKFSYHEVVTTAVTVAVIVLQLVVATVIFNKEITFTIDADYYRHFNVWSVPLLVAVILFVMPNNLNFVQYFKRDINEPLPTSTSIAILNWNVARDNINWSVLFILGASSSLFESFKTNGMSDELGSFLLLFANWPTSLQMLIIIVFFKLVSEFANSASVMYTMMPSVVALSKLSNHQPYFPLMAATLASSTPFHFVVGSPANAMVAAYVHIPPWKMVSAGVVPSLIAVTINWLTVALWSKAVWNEIDTTDVKMVLRDF